MPDFRSLLGKGSFTFFRHGESQGNRDGAMQGRLPSTLTERGREQARVAGLWLAPRRPDLILTSPLGRARETAEILARESGVASIEPLEELTEIDTGIFTGLTWAEAAARNPSAHRQLQQRSWDGVPGAEPSAALFERAEAVWSILFGRFAQGRRSIACVTHSGFLQWIIRSTMGWKSWMPLVSASGNCHVSELVVDNQDLGGGERSLYANWVRVNSPPAADDHS
jgi:broad specificity phosphatase PhoE